MAYFQKLKSGKWRAQVRDPSGRKVYSPADPLKSVVRQWANETEASIKRGDWVDPKLGKVTVANWYTECLKGQLGEIATKKKNASAWRAHVEPTWADWPISGITYEACRAWIGELAKKQKANGEPLGADMIALSGRLLRGLLDEAVRAKRIGANPMQFVKLPSPPKHEDRIIEPDEEARLYAACDQLHEASGEPVWLEFKVFLETLFGTGFRFQEAAGLLRWNVNPLKKTATVGKVLPRDTRELRRAAKSEAGTGRTVPITAALAATLTVQMGRHAEDLVHVSAEERKPLNYNNVRRRLWAKVLKTANIAGPLPTMHDIRHTYGTRLAERGVPPHEIKELMGHSRLASTERYLHAGEARMDRARNALSGKPVGEDASPVPHEGAAAQSPGKAAGETGA